MSLQELWRYGLGLHQVTKRFSAEVDDVLTATATSQHEHNLRIRHLRMEGLTTTQVELCNNYQVNLS